MANLIQKSVKMDPRVVAKIEEIVKNKRYWKFNSVVNQLLLVILEGLDPGDVNEVLRYFPSGVSRKPKINIDWIIKNKENEKD